MKEFNTKILWHLALISKLRICAMTEATLNNSKVYVANSASLISLSIQQVCNAVYVRLNYTQPLCACPSRKEPCSASLNADDQHTTELVTATSGKVRQITSQKLDLTQVQFSFIDLNYLPGTDLGEDLRTCDRNENLSGPSGLVTSCSAKHKDWKVSLFGHL